MKVKCPWCRVAERVHYFDYLSAKTGEKANVRCPTFKEPLSQEELGIGKLIPLSRDKDY